MKPNPTCDICGAECAYLPATLLSIYRMPGVEDVCPTCEKWANSEKAKLLERTTNDLKAAIRARVESFRAPRPPRRGWLSRIFRRKGTAV